MPELDSPKNIAVACLDKPGKVLLVLPVLQTLKETFPLAKITVFVREGAEGFLLGSPAIDALETLPSQEGLFRLADRFRKLEADTFIHVTTNNKLVLAAWLAKIPVRIGMTHKWHGFFFTRSVKINRAVSDRNEVEYNLELLKPFGIAQFSTTIGFVLTEAQKNWAGDFLLKKGIPSGIPYVIVHPGAKGGALHWKAERFGQLLSYLCQIKGLRVVITFASHEESLISEVTAVLFALSPEQKPILVNTGELVLRELAALCEKALCVVSGPFGPMHLAAAVGTPTVTIFSPAPEATPIRWGAWGNENKSLVPQNPHCAACQVGYCKKHDPMDGLSVPEVLEAMKEFISRSVSL